LFTSGEVRWLGIQVGTEAEQQPRVLLVSVPYALKAGDAETLGGKPASAYMLNETPSDSTATTTLATSPSTTTPDGGNAKSTAKSRSPKTTPLASCSVTSDTTATANSIAYFTTNCNVQSSAITQSGSNIGIGTSSPATRLHLVDDTDLVQFELQSASASTGPNLYLNNTGVTNGGKFLRSLGGNFQIMNNAYSAALLTVSDAGNVGIGTVTPATRLHLVDDTHLVQFELQSASASTGPNLYLNNAGVTNGGKFLRSLGGNFQILNNAYSAALLTVTDAGNVGIGTAAPAYALDVNGSGNFSGAVNFAQPATFTSGAFSGSNAGTIVSVVQGNSSGTALGASNTANGSSGSLGTAVSGSPTGVYGTSSWSGVYGAGTSYGLIGKSTGNGVYGSGGSYGVYGFGSGSGLGVYGAGEIGVHGATTDNSSGTGVEGSIFGTSSFAYAVWGFNGGSSGYAGYFNGDVNVNGTLTSGVKDFLIDHPLAPADKYFYHSSVESSEMMNIYTGNVVLDASGKGSVELPEWFEAENADFRYQLTPVGGPAPGLYIAQEITNHHFEIAGGMSSLKVSWQVTGVRQDAYAKAHPLQVEVEKPAEEHGYYLHPELYGAPEENGIEWARHPEEMKKMKELRENLVKSPQTPQSANEPPTPAKPSGAS
jgi:hypothetical protein